MVVAEVNPSTGVFTLPNDSVGNAAIADGVIATAKMATANISQWTNNAGYAVVGGVNIFTNRQDIDMGQSSNIALRLTYEESGGNTDRHLEFTPPADISSGGNPWRINTPDALTFQVDDNDALQIDDAGNVNIVTGLTVGGNPLSDNFSDNLIHVRDEKSANTAGGTFTGAAWRTRDLNTVPTNQISGASVSSNRITLPAGDYFAMGWAPAYRVTIHKCQAGGTTQPP